MSRNPSVASAEPANPAASDHLDSWKEIAAYLNREVRTLQRWEKRESLPVYRHLHDKLGSVYAYKSELDVWRQQRQARPAGEAEGNRGGSQSRQLRRPGSESGKIRLLVLPFENLSDDAAQCYFSDGLTEEMIAQLSRLKPRRLGIIGRTTAMHYKGSKKRIDQIGQELGVDYMLEGSVRRSDHRVRITAQLVSAKDQTQLWSRSYEMPLEDVLAIQIEVADKIARSLTVELLPDRHADLARSSTANAAAHDAVLRARYHWSNRTERSFTKAIDYFQKAAELDPGYAEAYAGLAVSYDTLGWYGALPAGEAYGKAHTAATRALQIDEGLAEAHAALAYAKQFYEWKWVEIENGYRRALDVDPNLGTAHHWYALFLTSMGRFAEAEMHMDCALELDPLSPVLSAHLGWILYFARQDGRAVEQLQKAVDLSPQFAVGHYFLGLAYEQGEQYSAAIKEFRAARDLEDDHPAAIAGMCHASGLAGKKPQAKRHLDELKRIAKRRHVSPYFLASACVGVGATEHAFTWLEKAFQERSGWLTNLNVDPVLDPIRSDARFSDLVRRVGLSVPGKSCSAD